MLTRPQSPKPTPQPPKAKATTPKAKAKAKATTSKAKATYLKDQQHNHVSTAFMPDNLKSISSAFSLHSNSVSVPAESS